MLHLSPGGSIPACAGEPQSGEPHNGVARVYPRVCGGTVKGNRPAFLKLGLSPRVRGNRSQLPLPRSPLSSWVYPRVCGGTTDYALFGPVSVNGVYPRVCGGTW